VPATVAEIVAAGRLERGGWWRRMNDADRQAVQHALTMPPERLWEEPRRLDRQQQALYEHLQTRVRAIAGQMKISSTLLAPRRELLKLIAGDSSGSLVRGWRRALIGEELLQLCGNPVAATAS
jgi:ribonuclease D